MEMQIKRVGNGLGICDKDINTIFDIVGAFPHNDIFANLHFMERVFLSDIKSGHYVLLSFIVGFLQGTEQIHAAITKNNLPCQRQN